MSENQPQAQGNSVTAIVGKNWNGGHVSNSGATDGGNTEITAAFCDKRISQLLNAIDVRNKRQSSLRNAEDRSLSNQFINRQSDTDCGKEISFLRKAKDAQPQNPFLKLTEKKVGKTT